MKTPRISIGALAVFCIAALVIGTSGAAAATPQGTNNNPRNGTWQFGPEKILDNLTAQGFDVSAIRTAVTTGDYETAHTLMQEFRTAHPDAFPARGEGAGKGPIIGKVKGDRILLMLDNLTYQGFDVSAIRTAVTTGDYETAHTLMQEFRTAHPDAFPARGEGAGKGPIIGKVKGDRILLMLDNLTYQGFDVSAIRTAVTTGDYETAHTLIQEFRTAHPDAFPTPREFAGCVHRCGQR